MSTLTTSDDTVYRIDKNGAIYRYIGWRQLSSDGEGKVIAIAAGDSDTLYKLTSGGIISRFRNGKWDIIDNNSETRGIAASGSNVYLIHSNGDIFKYNGSSWDWLSGILLHSIAIVADGGSLYSLGDNGNIWKWGAQQWSVIDYNKDKKTIVAGGGKLYQLRAGSAILVFNREPQSWDNLDSDPNAIQIAAANTGFYKLQNDYTIWKYSGEQGWERIISSDGKVIEISVGDYLYARKEGGEVIKYTENGWESVTRVVYEPYRPQKY